MSQYDLPQNGLNQFCAGTSKVLGWAGSFIILVMVVVVGIQVFCRYILNSPQVWSELLVQFTFIWLTLLGAAMATRSKENLAVTFIYGRFTGVAGSMLQVVLDLIIIAVSCLWLRSSVLQIRSTWDTIEAGINIRLGSVYLVFPLAFALIVLFSIEDIINQFRLVKQNRGGQPL